MAEAASLVTDGSRLALGGLSVYQHPMAFAHELIRQGRRDLTVIGVLNGPEVDILVAAGCVARIETSYVGLERFGLARNTRRAIEEGRVEIEDYSEMVAFDRFRASEDGLTFLATKAMAGTDLASNPRVKPFNCPLTGKPYYAVPPADPDVVVIHAVAADAYGNVLAPAARLLPQSFDSIMARSCDTVIVTAESIVDNDVVRRNASLTVVAGFRVTAVVDAPYGAHPCHSLGAHSIDIEHFERYVEDSKDAETFERYLDHFVREAGDHAGYLERIGAARLAALRTGSIA